VTVQCSTCGEQWERDPALEVDCPACGADVGSQCRRPSGHPCAVHAGRDKRALREVDGYERCSGTDKQESSTAETTEQLRLDALSFGS
jgi:predicted  nucleic acid-binding Zn-ribbon protein